MTDIDLDDFVRGYVECGLFCSSISEDDDRSLSDEYSVDDIDTDDLAAIRADLASWAQTNGTDLGAYCDAVGDWSGPTDSLGHSRYSAAERAGHDLWYSRGGHGVGFWAREDEGIPKALGERLHAAAGYTDPTFLRRR